jgi:hypothetical protein
VLLFQFKSHLNIKSHTRYHLVVEQTDVLLDKGNAELLSSIEDGRIVLATAGGSNILDS